MRVRAVVPPPQLAEHVDHVDHRVTEQLMGHPKVLQVVFWVRVGQVAPPFAGYVRVRVRVRVMK